MRVREVRHNLFEIAKRKRGKGRSAIVRMDTIDRRTKVCMESGDQRIGIRETTSGKKTGNEKERRTGVKIMQWNVAGVVNKDGQF